MPVVEPFVVAASPVAFESAVASFDAVASVGVDAGFSDRCWMQLMERKALVFVDCVATSGLPCQNIFRQLVALAGLARWTRPLERELRLDLPEWERSSLDSLERLGSLERLERLERRAIQA